MAVQAYRPCFRWPGNGDRRGVHTTMLLARNLRSRRSWRTSHAGMSEATRPRPAPRHTSRGRAHRCPNVYGADLREVRFSSLRDRVVLVPQEGFQLDATLLENVRFGRPGASDDDVRLAIRTSHRDERSGREARVLRRAVALIGRG